jgi:hypothetical protein
LTAAIAVAAPSNVPSFDRNSTGTTTPIGISAAPPIYTTLTDVTLASIVLVHVVESAIGVKPLEIDTPGLDLIGGMHGARWYTRTSDRFAMDRPTWEDWISKHDS